jgi:hypothetical protein
MDEPTRRGWSKPELIVLVRGGAEETVLSACKFSETVADITFQGSCSLTDCYPCTDASPS